MYEGIPDTILQNPEVMHRLLNNFRTDFQMIDDFVWIEEEPLGIPIAVCGGTNDLTVTDAALQSWKEHTDNFTLKHFEGGHAFIWENLSSFAQHTSDVIHSWTKEKGIE